MANWLWGIVLLLSFCSLKTKRKTDHSLSFVYCCAWFLFIFVARAAASQHSCESVDGPPLHTHTHCPASNLFLFFSFSSILLLFSLFLSRLFSVVWQINTIIILLLYSNCSEHFVSHLQLGKGGRMMVQHHSSVFFKEWIYDKQFHSMAMCAIKGGFQCSRIVLFSPLNFSEVKTHSLTHAFIVANTKIFLLFEHT